MNEQALSSPNLMVNEYFAILWRLASSTSSIVDQNEKRQTIAVCTFLAITTVETFLNIYFRIIVNEPDFAEHKQQIINDMNSRRSLEFKIKNWPQIILKAPIDFGSGIGAAFSQLKDTRNSLMHFRSSFSSLTVGNIKIDGLQEISLYHNLNENHARDSVRIAQEFIAEIMRKRGLSEEQIKSDILLWTGRPPA